MDIPVICGTHCCIALRQFSQRVQRNIQLFCVPNLFVFEFFIIFILEKIINLTEQNCWNNNKMYPTPARHPPASVSVYFIISRNFEWRIIRSCRRHLMNRNHTIDDPVHDLNRIYTIFSGVSTNTSHLSVSHMKWFIYVFWLRFSFVSMSLNYNSRFWTSTLCVWLSLSLHTIRSTMLYLTNDTKYKHRKHYTNFNYSKNVFSLLLFSI